MFWTESRFIFPALRAFFAAVRFDFDFAIDVSQRIRHGEMGMEWNGMERF